MLANVGGLQNDGYDILENPLDCVKEFLYADMTGVRYPRLQFFVFYFMFTKKK